MSKTLGAVPPDVSLDLESEGCPDGDELIQREVAQLAISAVMEDKPKEKPLFWAVFGAVKRAVSSWVKELHDDRNLFWRFI